jgi:membrane protease YdiL (CAAX protease family)
LPLASHLLSGERMESAFFVLDFVIVTAVALLWARWSKLDIGLSAPAFRTAEPWVLLFILWCTAQWAIAIFVPTEADGDWLAREEQLSFAEEMIAFVVLAPVSEELLFRGAMFAAFLRRWGPWTAVIVPSFFWGLLHHQFEWWVIASLGGSGALLAMVRWKSGSVYLPIGLHAGLNLLVTLYNNGVIGPAA